MNYLLAFVSLAAGVFTAEAQQAYPVKPVAPPAGGWFGDSGKSAFHGDNWTSWWNGWSPSTPVRQVPPGNIMLMEPPASAVCSIPLLEIPVAHGSDPMPVHRPDIIDRMPAVKVPAPPCDNAKRSAVRSH